MSGGVDSAVTAALLIEQGYRVEGLFMKNWEESDDVAYCSAQQDMEDAEQVCQELDIPLHKINFSRQYWDRVFKYFLAEYSAGRTPNPDIMCNKEIKFDAFLNYALRLGADKIATGHYARILKTSDGRHQLLKGLDTDKDQSYFLHRLGEHELSYSLFPLGEMKKTDVRQRAVKAGFDNHAKKDSTGICFIGERRFRDFLAQYLPAQKGPIKTLDGTLIGEHMGAMYYTQGQRQGLGIGGVRANDDTAWYVADKDVTSNTLYVVPGNEHPALFKQRLTASQCHWVQPLTSTEFSAQAKIRYRQNDQACHVTVHDDTHVTVHFADAQRAVSPGQSLVLYDGDYCLGGGVIDTAEH
ncbi:MAG: tRNA 2-thiouridine(34) synthase MnmA [Gammaproteobacteria bacterium]|nr:tRNA 2-thiouridine(34) synthase MnmA [Gammaproteobacteria bacterium]